jgi:hypothetical protein
VEIEARKLDGLPRGPAPLSNKLFALDTYIAATAPDSLMGEAVKLRRLADDDVGLAADKGSDHEDVKSVRQILAMVEGLATQASATAPSGRADTSSPADPEDALEDAHTHIDGLADILVRLREDGGENHIAYLGYQLRDHLAAAQDAFKRIFGLDDYAPKR